MRRTGAAASSLSSGAACVSANSLKRVRFSSVKSWKKGGGLGQVEARALLDCCWGSWSAITTCGLGEVKLARPVSEHAR